MVSFSENKVRKESKTEIFLKCLRVWAPFSVGADFGKV